MSSPASMRSLGARLILPVSCVLFVALTVPLVLTFGANAEEMVGLMRTPPERAVALAGEAVVPGRMVSSESIPVWGYVHEDGSYTPVMIDGHVGALSFVVARWLERHFGLLGARLESTLLGLLMVALCFFVARELAGRVAGGLAAIFAATSAHAAFVYLMVRPDEQLDALALLAALAAGLMYRRAQNTRWLYLAALLIGVGLAAKNTSLWAFVAAVVAMRVFHLLPRPSPRQWALGAALAALPLLPELAYVLRPSTGDNAFVARLHMISSPLEGLAPRRLAESIGHLVASVGFPGSYIGGYITGLGQDFATPLWPLAVLVLPGLAVAIGLAFAKRQPAEQRAFGAGLGLLLLVYWALYYRGSSYYMLLCPALPLAFALAVNYVLERAKALTPPRQQRLRWLALALAGLWVVNGVWEIGRLHQAVNAPAASMFDRHAQDELTQALLDHDSHHPIVTTYGMVGVLEMLSRSTIAPRYLDRELCDAGSRYRNYETGWSAMLAQLPPGTHDVVLVPNASPLDVNCEDGSQIAETLRPALSACGGRYKTLTTIEGHLRVPILELARIDIPASCRPGPPPPPEHERRSNHR